MSTLAGYVDDVAYPDRFHRELMPTWLHATAIALGYAPPAIDRPYRWCELGCGGGLGALVAAAANPLGAFTAIDAAAEPLARARRTAEDSGLGNLEFITADLREPALRDGEPFDFIVLHGLWSWVDDSVQAAILDFLRARLAPGGLVAIGYMSHPGASQLQALQQLMREAARRAQGDSAQRTRAGLALLRELADHGAGYFAEHPGAGRQLEAMEREAPEYLAHEFLGAHWRPQHAAGMIRTLASVDCAFVGSATPLENIDALSIPGALQPLLRTLPAGPLAETVRDLVRNQSLRRDLFQRAARPLDATAHLAALDALVYMAVPDAPATTGDSALRLDTRIGPVEAPAELVHPVLAALASAPQAFATLRALPAFADAPGLLNQVLQLLTWSGHVHPLRTDAQATSASVAVAAHWGTTLRLLPAAGSAVAVRPR